MEIRQVEAIPLRRELDDRFANAQKWIPSRGTVWPRSRRPMGASGGGAVALAGSLQLLAALPSPARLGFDRTPNPIREEPTATPIRNEGTAIRVPDDLGLGIEIDRETLSKFHVD